VRRSPRNEPELNATMVSLKDSHFDLFHLPAQFALDDAALDDAYRTVQTQVHPDRFAAAGDAQARRDAVGDPCERGVPHAARSAAARELSAALRGVDIGAENNTAMEPAFLMQQMEWREASRMPRPRATSTRSTCCSPSCATKARAHRAPGTLLDSGADQAAAEAVRQLMFIERVASEVGAQIERLET
jgi:molecular chaperone HscB